MTNLAMLAICAMLFLVTLRLLHLTFQSDDLSTLLFIGGMVTGLGMMTLTTTITKFIMLAVIFYLSINYICTYTRWCAYSYSWWRAIAMISLSPVFFVGGTFAGFALWTPVLSLTFKMLLMMAMAVLIILGIWEIKNSQRGDAK